MGDIQKNAKITSIGGSNNQYIVNSTFIQDFASEITKLMQEHRHFEAMALFQRIMKSVAAQHPAFPHWVYDLSIDDENRVVLKHKPTSLESYQAHPLRGKVSIRMTKELSNFSSFEEALMEAYGKQVPLELDAFSLEAWIGDKLIERMESDNEEPQIKLTIMPQEFPPPQPMKLYIVGSSFTIDYLEMRIIEMNKNGMIISNKNQGNTKIFLTIIINSVEKTSDFKFGVTEDCENDIEALYLYYGLLLEVKDKPFGLKNLKNGQDLFVPTTCELDTTITEELERHVDFLADLLKIEKFYGVKFYLPSHIDESDYESIEILINTIEGKPVDGTFSKFESRINTRDEVGNLINSHKESNDGLSFYLEFGHSYIELFGAVINFDKVIMELHKVKVFDMDKLEKKYAVMDDGDSVHVNFFPATPEWNKVIRKFYYTNR